VAGDHQTGPTPYDEVNRALEQLLGGVEDVLGDRCNGLYLYGSLATGDFEPERSDIDFVVVTEGNIDEAVTGEIRLLHDRLHRSGLPWTDKLEGSYVPRAALRRYDPAGAPVPMVNEGTFLVARHGYDWVLNRYVLRTSGITVAGPPARDIINPVTPAAVREAVRNLLATSWAVWATDATMFQKDYYQPFVVLTMCRALYAAANGEPGTKRAAAAWVLERTGARFRELINAALAWRRDDPAGDVGRTQELIRYVIGAAGAAGAAR
jgi:hypothetical protein